MTDHPATNHPATDESLANETATHEVLDDDATAHPQAASPKSRRVDAVSVVAGVLFIAIAILALTDRFWAEIDPVLVVGGAVVAVGVAMIVGVILRGRREREPIDG